MGALPSEDSPEMIASLFLSLALVTDAGATAPQQRAPDAIIAGVNAPDPIREL